jgi:hypothetical protein
MRHHDILPGYDYCLILDKLEKNYRCGNGSRSSPNFPVKA